MNGEEMIRQAIEQMIEARNEDLEAVVEMAMILQDPRYLSRLHIVDDQGSETVASFVRSEARVLLDEYESESGEITDEEVDGLRDFWE